LKWTTTLVVGLLVVLVGPIASLIASEVLTTKSNSKSGKSSLEVGLQ